MSQSIDEILDDLHSFVAGRGREDNFCYSKVYAPSSGVRCVDFSQWIGMRLAKNDTLALAVFQAQLHRDDTSSESIEIDEEENEEQDNSSSVWTIGFNLVDGEEENGSSSMGTLRFNTLDEKEDVGEDDNTEEVDNSPAAFERQAKDYEEEIKHILQFPFEEYFVNDIRLAKMDLLIAWLLDYSGEQFAKAMIPYHLRIKGENTYLEEYNKRRKKQYQLPAARQVFIFTDKIDLSI